ncbi:MULTISPECIES: hypothetical protein [Burkholderia]|uniref:hypothetical protein n=1 Tax=Burkholderia TaxID=32008 RepID=UPI000B0BAA5C|nr:MULTISPECIES: hypothetical protein [Burkholderia]RQM58378.1 hypothetical protein EHZ18_11975 [Burkholderia vietnamiensis]CAG9198945.1 hypothetical protein BVI2075_260066 [Burkholderia vietnamiensis]HDR9266602.1 hypothetical protein [Burkholderia vietnamiensis]
MSGKGSPSPFSAATDEFGYALSIRNPAIEMVSIPAERLQIVEVGWLPAGHLAAVFRWLIRNTRDAAPAAMPDGIHSCRERINHHPAVHSAGCAA